jgi:hypothetical protein
MTRDSPVQTSICSRDWQFNPYIISVRIASKVRDGQQKNRVRFLARKEIFVFSILSNRALEPTQYHGLFPWGVKQPGHEADYSSPSSAEVKNGGPIPPVPYASSWSGA